MSLYTVDASVFISAFIPSEPHHSASQACLSRLRTAGDDLACPMLVLVEVAAVLARTTGDNVRAQSFARSLASLPGMRLFTLDRDLAEHAVKVATEARLRGADAVYVALAARQGAALITWDQEMLTRAVALVNVATP
jgi:predicted nucleic acid-binding protein